MKSSLILVAILFLASAAVSAQENPAPAGTADSAGPASLSASGTLHYNLRYSETAYFGDLEGNQQESYFSGDASYANLSKRLPFTMQYGGGYGWVWVGQPAGGNIFQHLSLSQGMVWRTWNLTAHDDVSYTFQTPTAGFSGVPGTGEPIGGSGSTTPPDQTILTVNTRTLDNITTVAAGHRLDHATTLNLGGSAAELRYMDNNGQDINTLAVNTSVSRRLNAHDSVSGAYTFSRYGYSGTSYTVQTNTLQFSVSRQWNRQLTTTVAAGPMWYSSSGISSYGGVAMPSSTMLSLSATASYTLRRGSAGVSYFHGATGGSGFMLGAKSDNVGGNFSREFGKKLTVGVTGSYMRTSALIAAEMIYNSQGVPYLVPLSITPVTDARYGGVQASRKLGRYFNVFANYTAIDQSSNLQIAVPNTPLSYNANILNGLSQVIGFGIGYSPREIRFKR